MSKKNQVSYIKQTEPTFLQQFKSRAGYKEGPTVDDKKQELPKYVDDGSDERPDEKPQIVVLKSGDLTEHEVAALEKQQQGQQAADDYLDLSQSLLPNSQTVYAPESGETEDEVQGKLQFRKPQKRRAIETKDAERSLSDKKPKKESEMDRIRNRNLLSFGDDEEE